jgi:plasmid stabilization system protein ParE
MFYSIIWMPRTKSSYRDILVYLQQHWGLYQQIDKFETLTDEALEHISQFPALHQRSYQRNYRRCVLTKQTSLFYQVNHAKEQIEILFFLDNRQNPANLDL